MPRPSKRGPDETGSPLPKTAESGTERITLPIDANGLLAVDGMRESSKERVRAWLQDANLARQLGVTGPAASAGAKSAEVIPDALIDTLYDVLGTLEATIAQRVTACTPEQAALFAYSSAEKKALLGPTQAVLNKYVTTAMAKYGDEFALFALLTTYAMLKVQNFQTIVSSARAPVLTLVPKGTEGTAATESQDGMS